MRAGPERWAASSRPRWGYSQGKAAKTRPSAALFAPQFESGFQYRQMPKPVTALLDNDDGSAFERQTALV
jgi:hypothetical protein